MKRSYPDTTHDHTTEITMSGKQTSNEHAPVPSAAQASSKLEVVVLPVSDVERAKRFYLGLGWRLDHDFSAGEDWRVVQLTPPGSPCSINGAPTSHSPHSVIQTATAGCSRRSRRGCPDEDSATWTSRL